MTPWLLWLFLLPVASGADSTVLGRTTLSASVSRVAESGKLTEILLTCGGGIAGGAENCLVERKVDGTRADFKKADPAKAKELADGFRARMETSKRAGDATDAFLRWKISFGGKPLEGGFARPPLSGELPADLDAATAALSIEQDLLHLLN